MSTCAATIAGSAERSVDATSPLIGVNSSVVSVGVTNASGAPVDLGTFVVSFVNALNASAPLQQPDGCVAEDFTTSGGVPRFFLRARTAGWPASAVRANFDVSGGVSISEAGSVRLDENVGDLRPRNHLYIASGATNGGVAFALDTTALADGHHVLEAVAYEGTHVRTQARAAIPITIENTPLTAAMTVSNLDFTSATEGMFTIRIDASGASIAGIELFSQGGSVGVVSNAPTAVFNLAGSQFGAGRVPFHAIVTDTLGRRYRTAEFNTRFVGLESSIETAISGPAPLQLEWPGIAGRTYGILAATNLVDPFALVESLIAPHSTNLFWVDTNAAMSLRRFYRIQASE